MSAIEQNKDGIRLRIFLQPKASKDHIAGIHDDELKITITAHLLMVKQMRIY